MTPRRDVEVIDIEDDLVEIREQLRSSQRSRLPVRNRSSDEILGVLFVKDALDAILRKRQSDRYRRNDRDARCLARYRTDGPRNGTFVGYDGRLYECH